MKSKLSFLKIKNQADSNKAEIYINGDICDDNRNWGWEGDPDVYPLEVVEMLEEVKDKDLDVHINSGGGDVFAGVAISNMLKSHKKHTKAIVDGIAASIASVIAFGCDEIEIPSNAFLMIHKPYSKCIGNSDDMLKMAERLDGIQTGIVNTYLDHAKVDKDKLNEMINAETWLNGEQAQEYFNVNATESLEAVACSGDFFNKLKNKPKEIKNQAIGQKQQVMTPKTPDTGQKVQDKAEELERMKKEIEIELELLS